MLFEEWSQVKFETMTSSQLNANMPSPKIDRHHFQNMLMLKLAAQTVGSTFNRRYHHSKPLPVALEIARPDQKPSK